MWWLLTYLNYASTPRRRIGIEENEDILEQGFKILLIIIRPDVDFFDHLYFPFRSLDEGCFVKWLIHREDEAAYMTGCLELSSLLFFHDKSE